MTIKNARGGAPAAAEGKVIGFVALGSCGEVDLERTSPHILLSGMKKQINPNDSFS